MPIIVSQFPATVALSTLNGANGVQFTGSGTEYSGYSVSSAGDVNGDGITDILIGAIGTNSNNGASYLVFGHAGNWTTPLALSSLNGANGVQFTGSEGEQSGWSVNSAGDVNGDGVTDLIIGAYLANGGNGTSYLVFGHIGSWTTPFALSTLNGTNGVRLTGSGGEYSGRAVNSAGDVNGDGVTDLIIGAYEANSGNGASYLVFGHTGSWTTPLALSTLNGVNGVKFTGSGTEQSGRAVSSAGDVNGDGVTDLIIGAYRANGGNGASYLVFGHTGSWTTPLALSTLNGVNGVKFTGSGGENSGIFVSSAEDVNGDGVTDLIIGAHLANSNNGASYLVFGHTGNWTTPLVLSTLNGVNGVKFTGSGAEQSGRAVSSAGDVNGDGVTDLIIGANVANSNNGASYLVFGDNIGRLNNNQPFTLQQGSTLLFNSSYLNATYTNSSPTKVQFAITNLQHGRFELLSQPGQGITSFTQQQVNLNQVRLVTDGSCFAPSYQVSVNDGGLAFTPPVNSMIAFIPINPIITLNNLALNQGQTVILNTNNFNTIDPGDLPSNLRYTATAIQRGQFTLVSTPSVAITHFTQLQINSGSIQFISDGTATAPSYTISVQNSCGLTSTPQAGDVNFNLSPTIGNNQLTISEGTSVILTNSFLSATDPDNIASSLQFTVSNVQHGKFTTTDTPSVAITQFSQQNVTNGKIQFTQDGTCHAPAYSVMVTDPRAASSSMSTANIVFTPTNPVININTFTINQGQTIVLTNNNLKAIDSGDVDSNLHFTISNLQYGNFIPATFTQQDINNRAVQFVPDGSANPPSFTATTQNSCGLVSAPQYISSANVIQFNPTATVGTGGSNDTVRNSVIGGVLSGAVGLIFFGVKFYLQRKAQDYLSKVTDKHKQEVIVPIAKEMAANVKVAGCMGYISENTSRDFLSSIFILVRNLENNGISVSQVMGKKDSERSHLLHEIVYQTRLVLFGKEESCNSRTCTSLCCAEATPQDIEDNAEKIALAIKARLDRLVVPASEQGNKPLLFSPNAQSSDGQFSSNDKKFALSTNIKIEIGNNGNKNKDRQTEMVELEDGRVPLLSNR
jgi:hypothetical protein